MKFKKFKIYVIKKIEINFTIKSNMNLSLFDFNNILKFKIYLSSNLK